LIKKHLETYKLTDEELKSLFQKHSQSSTGNSGNSREGGGVGETGSGSVGGSGSEHSSQGMETKKIKQLCQEIVTLFLDLNTKTFNIEYVHHNKHSWDEQYIDSLFPNKKKVTFEHFKTWFFQFLDFPCVAGYTRILDHIKVGIDEQGRRTFNEFTILTTIGNGSFGKVRKCFHNYTKLSYAVKMMSKTTLRKVKRKDGTTGYDDVLNEINILKSLNHPNIIKIYMVLDDPNHDMMYLILENANKGVVLDLKKNTCLDEHVSKKYLIQMVNGFEYSKEKYILFISL
jgi:hypothetical protein